MEPEQQEAYLKEHEAQRYGILFGLLSATLSAAAAAAAAASTTITIKARPNE